MGLNYLKSGILGKTLLRGMRRARNMNFSSFSNVSLFHQSCSSENFLVPLNQESEKPSCVSPLPEDIDF